jgi:hypothetical protein
MSKYVVLHDKDGSPVYVNPEMVVAVYKNERRDYVSVYTILGMQTPFFVKGDLEEVRDIIWPRKSQI